MKLSDDFIKQIKYNCNVSDANYWGYFSMCNLLLKLRELYYHEHALDISSKTEKNKIAEWISDRENLWESLEEKEFREIGIDRDRYDPFEIDRINEHLIPENLLYGAGYGLLKKPTFFLGKIKSKFTLDDKNIWIVHEELCRDISPSFAMSQGNNIFIRTDIMTDFLYNKYLELKTRSEHDSLRLAFEHYGCFYDPERSSPVLNQLVKIADEIVKIFIWHEMGEINERDDFSMWPDIIAASTDRLTEFRLRGIKDVLSDTSPGGTIPEIIKSGEKGLLYFYTALLDETRKVLFPEILESVGTFIQTGDWKDIESSVHAGRERAQFLTDEILDMWNGHHDIEEVKRYLAESPLTACRIKKS